MISIICPVYNAEMYLRETVNSILSQSISDWELILVDDGSVDLSSAICDEYAIDSRIIVIHQKNSGPYNSRIRGMSIAKGDYLLFIDSDDLIAKDGLSKLDSYLTYYSAPDLLLFNYQMLSENGTKHNVVIFDESQYYSGDLSAIKRMAISGLINSLWIKCIKTSCARDAMLKSNPNDFLLIEEDLMMFLPILDRCATAAQFSECIYIYRYNGSSLTHRKADLTDPSRSINVHITRMLIDYAKRWNLNSANDFRSLRYYSLSKLYNFYILSLYSNGISPTFTFLKKTDFFSILGIDLSANILDSGLERKKQIILTFIKDRRYFLLFVFSLPVAIKRLINIRVKGSARGRFLT